MYKGKTDSSARGKSGVRYEWNAGDEIDAPKGDLDHPNVEWIGSDDIEGEHPIHKGAGYYELSNGETVRGKEKAEKAEAKL